MQSMQAEMNSVKTVTCDGAKKRMREKKYDDTIKKNTSPKRWVQTLPHSL